MHTKYQSGQLLSVLPVLPHSLCLTRYDGSLGLLFAGIFSLQTFLCWPTLWLECKTKHLPLCPITVSFQGHSKLLTDIFKSVVLIGDIKCPIFVLIGEVDMPHLLWDVLVKDALRITVMMSCDGSPFLAMYVILGEAPCNHLTPNLHQL